MERKRRRYLPELHIAHLIAGVAGLVIGGILAAIGTNRLNANSLVPKRTLEQLNRDVTAAKEHI